MTKLKVALITGASRGIGKEVAFCLAKEGFHVALIARSIDELEKSAREINTAVANSSASTHQADVTDLTSAPRIVSEIMQKFGRIDLLFNNAGMYIPGSIETSADDFDKMLQTNLYGAFSFIKHVVPIMKQQKSGYIINLASRAGKIGLASYGAYAASKFSLVGLSASLYNELVPLGIKVTCLCPSHTDTAMAFDLDLPPEERIQTTDIAHTVKWLLSLTPAACVKELVIECRLAIA